MRIRFLVDTVSANSLVEARMHAKASHRLRYRCSTSARPCHLSGRGSKDLVSTCMLDTFTDSSPFSVLLIPPALQTVISVIIKIHSAWQKHHVCQGHLNIRHMLRCDMAHLRHTGKAQVYSQEQCRASREIKSARASGRQTRCQEQHMPVTPTMSPVSTKFLSSAKAPSLPSSSACFSTYNCSNTAAKVNDAQI